MFQVKPPARRLPWGQLQNPRSVLDKSSAQRSGFLCVSLWQRAANAATLDMATAPAMCLGTFWRAGGKSTQLGNAMSSMTRNVGYAARSPVILLAAVIALGGCVAIFNATSHLSPPYYYVFRQLIWLALATVVAVGCAAVRAETWFRYAWPLSVGCLLLLFLVLLWGSSINGMRGWFRLGWPPMGSVLSPWLLQPSELAKPIFVLFLVRVLTDRPMEIAMSWRRAGRYLAWGLLWLVPLALQPDFGTLLVFAATLLVMGWLGGARWRQVAAAIGLGTVAAAAMVAAYPYVWRRLVGFTDPVAHAGDAGWHALQFRLSLANGGVLGSDQTLWTQHYLPLTHNDSIFAAIGERLGLVGLIPVVLLVGLWVTYGLAAARGQDDARRAFAIAGLTVMLALQALVHMGVTVGLMPPTGLTLPLLSYGGSSLVGTMASVGILVSLTRKDSGPHL